MNSFFQNTSNQEQAIRSFLRDYSNKSDNGQTIHGILSDITKTLYSYNATVNLNTGKIQHLGGVLHSIWGK